MMLQKFPRKDRELVLRFLEKVKRWAPPALEAVVLFGSMVRGDFGRGSDIDVLMVFDEENPSRHRSEIVKLITSLKPHREIRPVLTNLRDVSSGLLRDVLGDGLVLRGKLVVTPDKLALKPYRVISYDLSATDSTTRQRVARRVYGYTSRKSVGRRVREYRYKGLADRKDCYVFGRGVVALPTETARGFITFLKENSVKLAEREAYM